MRIIVQSIIVQANVQHFVPVDVHLLVAADVRLVLVLPVVVKDVPQHVHLLLVNLDVVLLLVLETVIPLVALLVVPTVLLLVQILVLTVVPMVVVTVVLPA